jgi:mono/diheme cytochrome c family protein
MVYFMKQRALASFAAVVLLSLAWLAAKPAAGDQTGTSDLIARGHYLVTGAGQCSDCHGEGFVGGPNHIAGPPGVPWAKVVPSLRGLTMFKSDADAIAFLETAKLPDGSGALRPMPKFQFNEEDATAIVAYFRSLK